jgi:4-hydroxy-2-oxoheptanedioate aldolase
MNRLDETLKLLGAPLLGMAVHRFDLAFVEMASLLGFRALWIEMEHLPITFREAADLCRLGSALGMVTMIRVPDASRDQVLKAAECRPDIIDLPMGNTPEMLRQLVAHARYAPEGNRGFFGVSRAVQYGLGGDIAEAQRQVNRELCLMSQIETCEAVARAEELCSVPGIDAIFLGPGDLSTSLGVTGQVRHPSVVGAMEKSIAIAAAHQKRVAIMCAASDAGEWARKGVDLIFCGSDTACLKAGARGLVEDARRSLAAAPPPSDGKTAHRQRTATH